jgi:voltage-gated potassium channel
MAAQEQPTCLLQIGWIKALKRFLKKRSQLQPLFYFTPMKKLRAFMHGETVGGRFFETLIQILILISLVTIAIETLPDLTAEEKQWLYYIELFSVIVFTIEYVLRIISSERPLRFMLSFMGIIDLIAILPFYLSFGFDLRSVRGLRMLRILRVFKLARYNKAFQRFRLAVKIAKEELVIFFGFAILLVYLTALGIYFFENQAQPDKFASVFDSLWWSVVTLTTVGYGDVYPITAGGKAFTILILFIGLGIVAIPTGLLSSALTTARELEKKAHDEKEELEQLAKEVKEEKF